LDFFFVFLILRRIGGEGVKYANEMQIVFQIIIKFVGIFWGIFFFSVLLLLLFLIIDVV